MEDFKFERVKKICRDLAAMIPAQSVSISSWKCKKGFFLTPGEVDQSGAPWEDFDSRSDVWTGPDEHYWFRTSVDVPQSFAKKPLWLRVTTHVDFWDAINPQFLLFINGELVQGLDANHAEVRLTGRAKAGERLIVDLQAYTGRGSDNHANSADQLRLFASLLELEESVRECYYNLTVPNEAAGYLEKDSMSRIRLQAALEKAVNLLDLRVPYSKEFYASLRECNRFLKNEVYKKLAGDDAVIATCIGHTHIDVAWWWTVEQTREKAVRSFATVLKLMDEYPEYKFMSSQPQLYQFVKERYPAMFESIKKRVKEGRWEAEGAMWLEADCNLTSGESLVRQILHGKKFFRDEFGVDSKIVWLPDVFGYSAALPQIMKKSGVDYFMTTKISWNQFNKFPYDTFWWKGIDGSEVFTHLVTTQNADQPKEGHYTTYNGLLDSVSVCRSWERYQQKELNNDVLITYGYGDGGGGPTRDMLEYGKRLTSGLAGVPKVRMESSRVYFDQLYNRAAGNPDLPRWVGELYLEYHRGTYTSMARNKRSNRRCELLWQDVELFSVLGERVGLAYNAQEIYGSWENILLNQFHDILPGSSIKEVYDTTKVEYEKLESRAVELISEKLSGIAAATKANSNDLVLFNSLSFARSDVAEVAVHGYTGVTSFIDGEGNRLPAQHTADNKVVFRPRSVPSKGYAIFTPNPDPGNFPSEIAVKGGEIDTPYYHVRLDRQGQFVSLFDKEANRELLQAGKKGNVLRAYEDKPMNYDNWDIDIYYTEKSWTLEKLQKMEWVEQGPVRAVLRLERSFLSSTVTQKIIFYAESRRIDFETVVDWKQHDLLLKVEFPFDLNAYEATYDIQFGSIKRPAHKNTSWDAARFEVCAQKWADLSEGGYGVALLNDCKYGYGICDGTMTLSLVKSGTLPNPVADQEEHRFTYALFPHLGDCYAADVPREADCLNVPLYGVRTSSPGTGEGELPGASLLSVDANNVVVETVKRAEDGSGIILRVYENKNRRTDACITWTEGFQSVAECDLLERELEKPRPAGTQISFTIKPFEIKTFKLRR